MEAAQPAFRPVVFIAMPFGKKTDAARTTTIDFDALYERAIRPAVERFPVECIRADEERSGGVIHVTMFERLLLAEVAIVDVTLANPNVFYELGVRHAARPRSTIIVGDGALPFDIAMIRALRYHLKDGTLDDAGAARFADALAKRVADALRDAEAKDSPLFQLIPQLPETWVPHEICESFRDRARAVDRIRQALADARTVRNKDDYPAARAKIAAIEAAELAEISRANAELVFDVLLSYRDVEGFDEVVALATRAPAWLANSVPTMREQHAFALNRRNGPGDRELAKNLLEDVLGRFGDSPETNGLLGRIYKDEYQAAAGTQRFAAAGALDEAIAQYRRGFNADPRDFYPGINLATLLALKGGDEAKAECVQVAATVAFAIARRGGLQSKDYWLLATALESAILGGDADTATRAMQRMAALPLDARKPWMFATTAKNLRMLQTSAAHGFLDAALVADVLAELDRLSGEPAAAAALPGAEGRR